MIPQPKVTPTIMFLGAYTNLIDKCLTTDIYFDPAHRTHLNMLLEECSSEYLVTSSGKYRTDYDLLAASITRTVDQLTKGFLKSCQGDVYIPPGLVGGKYTPSDMILHYTATEDYVDADVSVVKGIFEDRRLTEHSDYKVAIKEASTNCRALQYAYAAVQSKKEDMWRPRTYVRATNKVLYDLSWSSLSRHHMSAWTKASMKYLSTATWAALPLSLSSLPDGDYSNVKSPAREVEYVAKSLLLASLA